jgi:hypothetical protein
MLLLKLFGRVVNYVLTLGIIGFGWYQDPKLVKASFQWNAAFWKRPLTVSTRPAMSKGFCSQ